MTHPDSEMLFLDEACRQAGYAPGAVLLRHFANAVYLLDSVPVVVRVGAGPGAVVRATRAVAVARWLAEQDFPVTSPTDVPSGIEQPVILHREGRSVATTFWHYYPQPAGVGWPDTTILGRIGALLHTLPTPPVPLPGYLPLRSLAATVGDPAVPLTLRDEELAWLIERIEKLRAAFKELVFPLGEGLIHADFYTGNLLWNTTHGHHRVILGDWDSVCIGPREIDLIPTYADTRFGAGAATVDSFAGAYGVDLRSWHGFDTLYDIRELSTLTALVRLAHRSAASQAELSHRLALLMSGDRVTPWRGQ